MITALATVWVTLYFLKGLPLSATIPLVYQFVSLVSVVSFDPTAHNGQKMEARGLLYRDDHDAMLNLTSLRSLGACSLQP